MTTLELRNELFHLIQRQLELPVTAAHVRGEPGAADVPALQVATSGGPVLILLGRPEGEGRPCTAAEAKMLEEEELW